MNKRKGLVFVHNDFAGIIEQKEDLYYFTYDEKYISKENAVPISLTMPVQSEPYTSKILFPFFDGLIPEGWLLDIVSKNWKIDPSDRMSLLLTVCMDCIGAVYVQAE